MIYAGNAAHFRFSEVLFFTKPHKKQRRKNGKLEGYAEFLKISFSALIRDGWQVDPITTEIKIPNVLTVLCYFLAALHAPKV